jgi:nucleoside-diphosphate kinase
MERSLVLIKPDAYEKKVVGKIIRYIKQMERGVEIVNADMVKQRRGLWREHYAHLVGKDCFPKLEAFMQSGPVLAMEVRGADGIIQRIRDLLGPTDSAQAPPHTIRGQYGDKTNIMRNAMHASDSEEAAAVEIERFFPPQIPHLPFERTTTRAVA